METVFRREESSPIVLLRALTPNRTAPPGSGCVPPSISSWHCVCAGPFPRTATWRPAGAPSGGGACRSLRLFLRQRVRHPRPRPCGSVAASRDGVVETYPPDPQFEAAGPEVLELGRVCRHFKLGERHSDLKNSTRNVERRTAWNQTWAPHQLKQTKWDPDMWEARSWGGTHRFEYHSL